MDALGWTCSLLLLALLASRLRGARAHRGAPPWVWLALQVAASGSLLVHALALGRSLFAATLLAVAAAAVWSLRRLRNDRRGTVITLRPANDEGSAVRLRVLSLVLQRDQKRALRWH